VFAKSVYRFVIFFLSLLCGFLRAQNASLCISIHPENHSIASIEQQIKDCFPDFFTVNHIAYNADVCLQKAEFDYLVDIKNGDCVSSDLLFKSVVYLIKKQKFETIVVTAVPVGDTYNLFFDLTAFWTFRKLKFKGIFVGKEHYRQFYLMECGERFDKKKHADSIQKIKESFKKDGYFKASVRSHFSYDNKTKEVIVNLDLKKGPRFFIGSVDVKIQTTLLNDHEKAKLNRVIYKTFVHRLIKNYYIRDVINAETQELKHMLAKSGYLHVDIELDEKLSYSNRRVDLRFTIHLHYKKKFFFSGNRFFSHEQLLETILVFGRSTSLLPASILSEELIKAYHKKGFWSVTVEPQEIDDAYHFSIIEGKRACINEIELRNLDSFEEKNLIKKFFLPVVRKRFYDNAEIERSIDSLMAYLLKQGFWQATLLRERFEPIDERQAIYKMVLIFDEGKRSFLKKVTIENFKPFQTQGPFKKIIQQQEPIPFDINLIDQQRQWLIQELQKKGYYQPKIKPECTNEDGEISLNWCVDVQNSKVQFDKTVLLGSSTFPFEFVQRELDYRIGDAWHPDTLRHSISRLKKMEIFESIHLFPDKDINGPEKIMLLKLQKDDPYEIKMRTGLGVQHVTKTLTTGGMTYRVGGSFIYKNPLNAGDQFRIDADFTRAIRLVNAQYRRPWIFGVPVNALFQGYTNRFEYPGFIGSQKNLYTVIQQGFLANFNTVRNNIDAAVSTGFEVVDTFIDESTVDDFVFAQKVARAINFCPELLDKNIPFFQIQPTVMLYFLDNTINPTRGSFSVFSAKGMFPLSKLSPSDFFIRVLAEQSFFIPFLPLVFAVRARVGHIFHQTFNTIIPIERFYLGGANSIRSYETDQCPPLGVVCDDEDKELFVPQGGRSLANLNLEMRFPLYNQLGGVIFGDIGALSINRLTDIKADDMLSGIGFGLRYNTPIGPLRFDFAWRGNKHDGVGRPYAWFLSFGNAFI
jgi:outer membrane protein assembly factor BamA